MSADSEHTWTTKTIAATVKWRDVGGYDVWHATFTDEESMKRFMQQPDVKVLGVTLRNDPLKVLPDFGTLPPAKRDALGFEIIDE